MPSKHGRQVGLTRFEDSDGPDPKEVLTPAEYKVWRDVEKRGRGPREVARRTDRSPGTVGNLLDRARTKLDGQEAT